MKWWKIVIWEHKYQVKKHPKINKDSLMQMGWNRMIMHGQPLVILGKVYKIETQQTCSMHPPGFSVPRGPFKSY